MAKTFSDEWWQEQADDLYRGTERVLFEIFFAGGKVGERLLPKKARVLLDWDVFNQAAVEYLDLYRLNTVAGIEAVTQQRAVAAIQQWIKSGEPLNHLTAKLDPIFGASRAQRIAVTEVTRTYAAGNISAWKTTGLVSQKVWQTANDERVCPICGPLHDQVVNLEADFSLDQLALPPEMALSGNEYIYFQPPAHPNCRCWLKPVVSEVSLRESIRSLLSADLRLTVDMLRDEGSHYVLPLSLMQSFWEAKKEEGA
jgi:SPP1 gp7 family putative phage head morphogenesis protein